MDACVCQCGHQDRRGATRPQRVTPLEPQPHQHWAMVREQGARMGRTQCPRSWVQSTAALCPFMGQPGPSPLLIIQHSGASAMLLPILDSSICCSQEERHGESPQDRKSGRQGKRSSIQEAVSSRTLTGTQSDFLMLVSGVPCTFPLEISHKALG